MTEITFAFEAGSAAPMYAQLAEHIVEEIRAGRLRVGEKLPSKRGLCAHLGVSLSTVESAYAILTAEGYVQARPRSGYVVCPYEVPARAAPGEFSAPAPQAAEGEDDGLIHFSTGEVDTSVFPFASWARLNKEVVQNGAPLLRRGHPQGDACLRAALCAFLHQYRGVECTPEQIVIGSGMEYVLRILMELLPDALFALEDPGYAAVYRAMNSARRAFVPIPLDDMGMRADALSASGAHVAYVTPSHQFPSGITMPAGRRAALLGWASAQADRYVIEDDYDSEFRYLTRPIPAMQGVDENGRVIYVGTFSRSIAPSIRVAYVVLPPRLLALHRERFWGASSTVSRFEQHTLCRFIEQGLYARHLRRVGNLYRQRRALLLEGLEVMGIQVRGAEAGLHFLATVRGADEGTLVKAARAQGVALRALSEYAHGAPVRPSTLVMGYAGMTDEQIVEATRRLARAWSAFIDRPTGM